MMREAVRRYLTTTREIEGTWTRTGPTQIKDSSLGYCRTDPYDNSGFYVTLEPWGEIRVALQLEKESIQALTYVRSLLVHFPRQDRWYRRFGARDIYRAHQALGPAEKISVGELSRRLRIASVQVSDPCTNGATLWYRAGDLLGGGRLGVRLDPRRRYVDGVIG